MPSGKSQLPGPISKAVAAIIADAISSREGLTQSAVAKAAEMSEAQFSRAVRGKKVFTLEELDRVCFALGLDIAVVIDDGDLASRHLRNRLAPVTPIHRNDSGSGEDVGTNDEHIGDSWEVQERPVENVGKKAAKKGQRKADTMPHAE